MLSLSHCVSLCLPAVLAAEFTAPSTAFRSPETYIHLSVFSLFSESSFATSPHILNSIFSSSIRDREKRVREGVPAVAASKHKECMFMLYPRTDSQSVVRRKAHMCDVVAERRIRNSCLIRLPTYHESLIKISSCRISKGEKKEAFVFVSHSSFSLFLVAHFSSPLCPLVFLIP